MVSSKIFGRRLAAAVLLAVSLSNLYAQERVQLCNFDVPESGAHGMRSCVIDGTWEFHGIQGPLGDFITFFSNGMWTNSQGATGTYKVVRNSILLDYDGDDATNYFALTYLGKLPDGQLIFAQQFTLGFQAVD